MSAEAPSNAASEPAGAPTCTPPCATAHQVAMTAVNEWLHRHANNLEFNEDPGSLGACAAQAYLGCVREFARHQCAESKGEAEGAAQRDEPALDDVIAMVLRELRGRPCGARRRAKLCL